MASNNGSTGTQGWKPKSARQKAIAEAVTTTKKLERPPSITPRLWRGVQAVLVVLARHIPDAYPSEARLAKQTGYSRPSIERYIRAARESGLIEVESFQHGPGWRHNRYRLTWLHVHQIDGHHVHQIDGLKPPTLRVAGQHTFGVKSEPPSAALAAAGHTETNPLDARPTWYPGWDPAKQLSLPPETVWRPNLYAGHCTLCGRIVPPKAGWIAPPVQGFKWLVVHGQITDPWFRESLGPEAIYSVCPSMIEGWRPGGRLHTVGDIAATAWRPRPV